MLTALGAAVAGVLKALTASDCFPVGISASRDETWVALPGQYNPISILVEIRQAIAEGHFRGDDACHIDCARVLSNPG